MKYKYGFSKEKSAILREARGIGFEDIIQAIKSGNLIDDRRNPNQKKYSGQRLFVVKIGNYIYGVPYIIDNERQLFFLKTLYPSRKLTKEHIKNHEK